MNEKQKAKDLIKFISAATSPYQVVEESAKILTKAGFQEINPQTDWQAAYSGKYFMRLFSTSLFAFTVPSRSSASWTFHLAAAHTDSPCLHIKPDADLMQKNYLRLNTEVYGGPILNTWLDRPLSIAGRVALRSENVYKPELRMIDFEKPLLTIPNLAIHMNREVNKGVELSKQKDMLPLLSIIDKELTDKNHLLKLLAKHLKVATQDILDFDLYIYNAEQGCLVGQNEEFLSCPRIDNLSSCHALLHAITAANREDGINMIALFDNEEVGSRTSRGADSNLLPLILQKLYTSLGKSATEFTTDIMNSFLLSVDVAHALHPNLTDKYDPSNYSLMNDGVVFKLGSNQRYANDNEAIAIAQQLCETHKISYKKCVNHSDVAGGSTIGTRIASLLPMNALDIGVPILAMHSARELMGIKDQSSLEAMITAFFQTA